MYNKIGIVKKTLELAEIALQYAQSEVIKDIIAQDIKYFKDN
jgi:hypothetical protein